MSERLQEVMLLRLITGEDIIAFIEDNADETFTVISPMLIEIQEHRATKQELMFLRHWLPTQLVEENSAIINKTKILTAILPSEKFYEHYVNIVDELHEQKEATKEDSGLDGDEELENKIAMLQLEEAKANNRLH